MMITTPIDCDNCDQVYDLHFDEVPIVMRSESGQVTLLDAERERFNNREFGRCPDCLFYTPLMWVLGAMQDAVEESGIAGWLESEIRYRAESHWAGGNSKQDNPVPLRAFTSPPAQSDDEGE